MFRILSYEVSNKKVDEKYIKENDQIFEYTPLIKAILKNDITLVKHLLVNGADVNEPDEYGTTPLMYSLIYPVSKQILITILRYKPNLYLKNLDNTTAFFIMFGESTYNYEFMKILLKHFQIRGLKPLGIEIHYAKKIILKKCPEFLKLFKSHKLIL